MVSMTKTQLTIRQNINRVKIQKFHLFFQLRFGFTYLYSLLQESKNQSQSLFPSSRKSFFFKCLKHKRYFLLLSNQLLQQGIVYAKTVDMAWFWFMHQTIFRTFIIFFTAQEPYFSKKPSLSKEQRGQKKPYICLFLFGSLCPLENFLAPKVH